MPITTNRGPQVEPGFPGSLAKCTGNEFTESGVNAGTKPMIAGLAAAFLSSGDKVRQLAAADDINTGFAGIIAVDVGLQRGAGARNSSDGFLQYEVGDPVVRASAGDWHVLCGAAVSAQDDVFVLFDATANSGLFFGAAGTGRTPIANARFVKGSEGPNNVAVVRILEARAV